MPNSTKLFEAPCHIPTPVISTTTRAKVTIGASFRDGTRRQTTIDSGVKT